MVLLSFLCPGYSTCSNKRTNKQTNKIITRLQWNLDSTNLYLTKTSMSRTVFFAPVIVKYYMKTNLDIMNPRFNALILPVQNDFVKSRFHCTNIISRDDVSQSPFNTELMEICWRDNCQQITCLFFFTHSTGIENSFFSDIPLNRHFLHLLWFK